MCFDREGEILLDGVSNFSLPRIISFTYSVVVPTCYYLAKTITVVLFTTAAAVLCNDCSPREFFPSWFLRDRKKRQNAALKSMVL